MVKLTHQLELILNLEMGSLEISNIIYSDIDISEYNGLEKINFSNEANFRFNSSISKNKIFSFLELEPIIFEDGKYKIVESFVVNYKALSYFLALIQIPRI